MENSKSKRNIELFNGEKYSVWKFRIRALLNEMDILNVIDEEHTLIYNTPCQDWEKNNRIAKLVSLKKRTQLDKFY
ncbi:unnamed protein product [Euphydryas editha]|uniref:DUF4219 domain-containing protein n=1 Tax=Euphydryas editha TaxID=104508 RepID=A0AAU9URT5_EUPED|nr:unnamed protein product [Euphydryas editha]